MLIRRPLLHPSIPDCGPVNLLAAEALPELSDAFTVLLHLGPYSAEDQTTELLTMPGLLRVRICGTPVADSRQNYTAAGDLTKIAGVEAHLSLNNADHPEWKQLTIGAPIARISDTEKTLLLRITPVKFELFIDGELADEDYPIGTLPEIMGPISCDTLVSEALLFPEVAPLIAGASPAPSSCIQYWCPEGHNSWVGDVAAICFNGRVHLFYLKDRRHHRSRFGTGAHYFEHLSSADLITWIEHDAAVPIQAQTESIGTGSPFVWEGALHLAYGLHASRLTPEACTTTPYARAAMLEAGKSVRTVFADHPEKVPSGATYARMDSETHFVNSEIGFHPCENPSVFVTDDNKLRMFANYGAKGTWESEALDAGWHCIDPEFPDGGDCTFYYRHGEWEFIIGGFTRMYRRRRGTEDAWEDLSRLGRDLYDGMSVPAPIPIPTEALDSRMAG